MKNIDLPGLERISSGKVREMFAIEDKILMVTTDRMSAFDVVLPDSIPNKGKVLTQISAFWFEKTKHLVENHFLTMDVNQYPKAAQVFREELEGRSMLVRRSQPLLIECVVRGYLAGSGWHDYATTGSICGIELPTGLRQSDRLPEPIFTPATKAESGHDENISFEEAAKIVGNDMASRVREISLNLYKWGRDYAQERGLIICDTKFEFGLVGSELILIDEVLTPDSSRFWPADTYESGKAQPSFDKQFLRDYLETLDWDKSEPGPELPEEIVQATAGRYREAFERLTLSTLR